MLLENLHNYDKMSSSNDKNETQTQESFRSKTTIILDNLLPPKSREMLVPENIKKNLRLETHEWRQFFFQSPYFRTISTNQPILRKPSTLMEHKLYSMLSHSENHLVPPIFNCCIIYIFFFTYLEDKQHFSIEKVTVIIETYLAWNSFHIISYRNKIVQ